MTDKRTEMVLAFGEAALRAAGTVCCASTDWKDGDRTRLESPIEEMLLMALLYDRDGRPQFLSDVRGRLGLCDQSTLLEFGHKADMAIAGDEGSWLLFAQEQVGAYRLDFALVNARLPAKIAIECDGHDYHERTKAHAARDRKRDRVLQGLGWRVMRFTGSEIYKDAHACADEVYMAWLDAVDAAMARHEATQRAIGEGRLRGPADTETGI